jgi:SAM-dependent methyltransferase
MLGLALVRPLEDDWRDTLDAVARRRGWPTGRDVAKLAARVADLSAAYNDASVARASAKDAGAARLGFAFARDVPKGAAAVRELVATGTLELGGAPLRVLDVGAGLGATTWGLVRALEARRRRGLGASGLAQRGPRIVEATWLDPDAQALQLAEEVVRERDSAGRGGIELRVRTIVRPVWPIAGLDDLARFDVVLVGQVLSELDVGVPAEERVDRHAALLGDLLERFTGEHGSLVVVEPALRDRTRHLHRVRDALASRGATVFAPCMHGGPCPALARESDWCHEDLPVDLPGWLVPVARAAGLRREGLTFSYLVVRRDGVRLADSLAAPPTAVRLRVVSELIRSKGKREAFVCGELSTDGEGGPPLAARVRAMRLDRCASDSNASWEELRRGDVLVVDPAMSLREPRIGASSAVIRAGDTESH